MLDTKSTADEIHEVETWLINNPDSNWEHRYDMIAKLAKLKKELEQNASENGL